MRVQPDLSEFEQRPEKAVRSSIEIGADGGELQTGALEQPIELASDWRAVLAGFGLDPDEFYVVDDTVKMSKWQQSKRTEDGHRDIVWLYSYKARFSRRTPQATEADINELRAQIKKWRPKTPHIETTGEPCTFLIAWADWQIGKSEGGGVEATVARVQQSFTDSLARINELRKAGRNIRHVAIFNMGDPSEGCDNNYASQRATVQLNMRAQLNLVLDLWTQGVAALQPDIFASVLCNHGEWTRNGGSKPVTSDSDNVGGYLGDTLQRIFSDTALPNRWHIAHDEMVQMIDLSGVPVAITHGHKISGKEHEWLRGQSQRLQYETGTMPRLWITAHRHHLAIDDFGPFFRLQCPSLDGGSKWFSDMTGKWSTPGTLTALVGNHDPRGWSDLAIL